MPTQVGPFRYEKFSREFGTPSRARLGSAEGLSLGPGLENVWRKVSFRERCPELQAHESAGGVARCTRIIAVLHVCNHREIGVTHHWVEIEAVIVRNQRDLAANRLAPAFHLAPDEVHIGDGADLEAFEVDEYRVALLIVGDPLAET